MENELEALKTIVPSEAMNDIYKQQNAEREAKEAAKRAQIEKYSNAFKLSVEDKDIEILLRKKVTPDLRHKLRGIVRDMPKMKIAVEHQRLGLEMPEVNKDGGLLYTELIKAGFKPDEVMNYINGVPDENHEKALEIYVLKYFKAILAPTAEAKVLIETPVELNGEVNGVWNEVDFMTALESVAFFRRERSGI